MNPNRFFLVALIIVLGLLSAGCSDEDSTLESIKVEPHYWETTLNSDAKQFVAIAHYSDGDTKDITHKATWESSSLPVSYGAVTFNESGSFTVSASYGGDSTSGSISGTTLIKVNPAVQSLEIIPGVYETILYSEARQLLAVGRYDDDSTVDITDKVVWADDASPDLLSFNVPGLIHFHTAQEEPFQITAVYTDGQSFELTDTISVTVNKALMSIDITMDSYTAGLLNVSSDGSYETTVNSAAGQFYAIGVYNDESTADITGAATWTYDSTSGSLQTTVIKGEVFLDKPGKFSIKAYVGENPNRIFDKLILVITE